MWSTDLVLHAKVVDFVKTSRGARKFMIDLDTLVAQLYSPKNFYESLHDVVDLNTAYFVQELLTYTRITVGDTAKLKELFLFIKEDLKKTHQIKFVFAVDPTYSFIEYLYKWVRENISTDLLINIDINPDIIGGAVIIYKGLYKDNSLYPVLSNYFINNKEDVQRLL